MNKITKKILQVILYLVIFYYLGRLLYQNWQKISSDLQQANLRWLLLALAIFTVALLSQSVNWHLLLRSTGKKVIFSDSYKSFFRASIVRYLPGGIWGIFSKLFWIIKLGINKGQALFLVIVESVVAVITGSLIFLVAQPPVPFLIYFNLLFFVLALAGIIMLLSPKMLFSFWRLLTKQQITIVNLSWQYLSGIAALSLIQWLIFGLGIYFIQIGFHLAAFSSWTLAGIFGGCWVIGFIILIAPTGLGVREGVFTLMLANSVTAAAALVIAILSRVLLIIGEMIGFILTFLAKPRPPELKQETQSPPQPKKLLNRLDH